MGVTYKVSVVIPAYRSEAWIGRAIRSVIQQPDVTTEVIVIEDGVFDETRRVVESFPEVRLVTFNENQGAQVARNFGLAEARAEFVMFLDADDYLEGPALRGLADALRLTRSDVAFAPWRMAWSDEQARKTILPRELTPVDRVGAWLTGDYHPPCSILWRRSSLLRRGGWKVGLRRNQDGEVVIRCLLDGCTSAISHDGIGVYWQHASAHRVSSLSIAQALPSQDVIRNMVDSWITENPSQGSRLYEPLAIFCYSHAKAAFFWGETLHGKTWLSYARKYGLTGHPGKLSHRLFAGLLGLSRKQRLLAWLYEAAPLIKTIIRGR